MLINDNTDIVSFVENDDRFLAEFLRDKFGNLWIEQIWIAVYDNVCMHGLCTDQITEHYVLPTTTTATVIATAAATATATTNNYCYCYYTVSKKTTLMLHIIDSTHINRFR